MALNSFRRIATAFAVGSAVITAQNVVAAPSTHAKTTFGAIATSQSAHKWGRSFGRLTEQDAQNQALTACGVNDCKVLVTFTACAALAQTSTDYYAATAASVPEAKAAALKGLPGSTIAETVCSETPNRG